MFLTQEAVRLAEPGTAEGTFCEGCPPLERLFAQFAEGGGELLACPFCVDSRKLDAGTFVDNARVAGGTEGDDERPGRSIGTAFCRDRDVPTLLCVLEHSCRIRSIAVLNDGPPVARCW